MGVKQVRSRGRGRGGGGGWSFGRMVQSIRDMTSATVSAFPGHIAAVWIFHVRLVCSLDGTRSSSSSSSLSVFLSVCAKNSHSLLRIPIRVCLTLL